MRQYGGQSDLEAIENQIKQKEAELKNIRDIMQK